MKHRFMTGGRRKRQRSQRWQNPPMIYRAGTKGFTLVTSLLRGRLERTTWAGRHVPSCLQVHPLLRLLSMQTRMSQAAAGSLAETPAKNQWLHMWETSAQLTDAISLCPHWARLGRWHISDRTPSPSRTLKKKSCSRTQTRIWFLPVEKDRDQ